MQNSVKRRGFLKMMAGVGATALSTTAVGSPLCLQTPVQPEGPFYPGDTEFVADNDLTRIVGGSGVALGQVIHINGVVRDLHCRPVPNANVEIWQACASGRYNHNFDPNPAPLDPNFRYWGETFTNELGEYSFKTILPGAYPAADDWDRPPHIHFRIAKLGYKELITQMYFKGEPLNDMDKILTRVPRRMWNDIVVDFTTNPADPTTKVGEFNISIESV